MNFSAAIQFALENLESKLPKELSYHSFEHTLRVMDNVKVIARGEGLNEEEEAEVLLAAAFHDIGFLVTTIEHEKAGCKIAAEELPAFGFDAETLTRIQKMILATKVPQRPVTQQEKILCDADLAYLSFPHYAEIAEHLYQELKHLGRIQGRKDWQLLQIKFFKQHVFFSDYAKAHFIEGKKANKKALELNL